MSRRGRSASASSGISPKRARRSEQPVNSRAGRDVALGGSEQPGRRLFLSDSVFVERNEALKPISKTADNVLQPISLDFHLKENRLAHHTNEYGVDELIVRRGQSFFISVTFDRVFNPEFDKILFQFSTGSRPQESKCTLIRLPVILDPNYKTDDWHATLVENQEKVTKLSIVPAADASIGYYQTFVETQTRIENGKFLQQRREFYEKFLVLFNAWCPEDQVYISEESWRYEYVLNQRGSIWIGSSRSNSGLAWNFGQMEDVCLEAALWLMDKAELVPGARSNATSVLRCMSKMANSNDEDNGVLTGRWTDAYPKGCTVPWAWTGSVAILDEFMRTKKAVNFGQCWVFSGLITTLCRALGIPTRSVTNFESAHDTDVSMTIDYHWNEDDEPLPDYNDSVWNFHVWNESYMKRPDLPDGNDGWQAFDSTPQEMSEGVMQCGPASVNAIREGHVYLPNDTPFIFAEVNGDRVHWLVKKDGSMEVQSKETATVGLNISTKAVGSSDRHDLTNDYKYREGSEEERRAVKRAFRYSSRRGHQVYDIPEPDVDFKLIVPDNVQMGNDFKIKVALKNKQEEERHITAKITAVVSYYTGVSCEQVGQARYLNTLAGNAEGEIEFPVISHDYAGVLKPESMVTVYLKGTVSETGRTYAHVESFHIKRPGLSIQLPEKVVIGESFEVSVKFTNPLSEKLTGGVFHIEAPGLIKSLREPHRKAIPAKAEVVHTCTLSARKSGDREILVNFSADQLAGVTGEAVVYVSYPA